MRNVQTINFLQVLFIQYEFALTVSLSVFCCKTFHVDTVFKNIFCGGPHTVVVACLVRNFCQSSFHKKNEIE